MAILIHSRDDKRDGTAKKTGADNQEKLEEVTSMDQFRQILPLYGLPRPKLDLLPIGVEP
ncbi:hypothetical protein COOONC_00895 [Cooperia oncophora]